MGKMLCSNQYSMFFKTITNPNSGQLGQNLGIGTRTFHSKSTFFRVSGRPTVTAPVHHLKLQVSAFKASSCTVDQLGAGGWWTA